MDKKEEQKRYEAKGYRKAIDMDLQFYTKPDEGDDTRDAMFVGQTDIHCSGEEMIEFFSHLFIKLHDNDKEHIFALIDGIKENCKEYFHIKDNKSIEEPVEKEYCDYSEKEDSEEVEVRVIKVDGKAAREALLKALAKVMSDK